MKRKSKASHKENVSRHTSKRPRRTHKSEFTIKPSTGQRDVPMLQLSKVVPRSDQLSTTRARKQTPATQRKAKHSKKRSMTARKPEKVKLPASPKSVLKSHSLQPPEQAEIKEYSKIYYIGKTRNTDYHTPKADYNLVMHEHIAYRYEVKGVLGSGSFGQVVHAYDHKDKIDVAIKIIKKNQELTDQAMTEIDILKFLKERDRKDKCNIVRIDSHFMFRGHMFIVFERLGISLYDYLKSHKFKGCPLSVVNKFARQILEALNLQHRYNIVHCDLKPENILLRSAKETSIKVIDYGSSCFYDDRIFTYIQSRYYRAPEIILGIDYTTKIDMWSFGCLLAELYTGKPLFAGEDESDLLSRMMELLGVPPYSVLRRASRALLFFGENDQPTEAMCLKRKPGSKSLKSLLQKANKEFVALVSACLEWDPVLRISAEGALQHLWIHNEHDDSKPVRRTPSFRIPGKKWSVGDSTVLLQQLQTSRLKIHNSFFS